MVLAVTVTWEAQPGAEERVEAILLEMVEVTRREPGCLMYQPHRTLDQPATYLIYEQFVDEDAFRAHLASAHYARLIDGEVVHLLEHRERTLHTTLGPR